MSLEYVQIMDVLIFWALFPIICYIMYKLTGFAEKTVDKFFPPKKPIQTPIRYDTPVKITWWNKEKFEFESYYELYHLEQDGSVRKYTSASFIDQSPGVAGVYMMDGM